MSKPQSKKINALDQDESALQPAPSVEVVVPSVEVVVPSIEITPELEQEIKSAASVSLSRIVPPLPPAPTYTTAFYQNNGIPICSKCGEKYRTDRHGLPLCPVDAVDCPRQP